MKAKIREASALYYLRATPFTDHGELNYNGILKDKFFFDHLFSSEGKYGEYVKQIKKVLNAHTRKTILLTGNQGCGKTTFIHHLERECPEFTFLFFDFDQNTSHPTLAEYIERLSNYLHDLLREEGHSAYNAAFYNLFMKNRRLIVQSINADNNINNFFKKFHDVFILNDLRDISKEDFIIEINRLYFNQILSLIILWHLSKMSFDHEKCKPMVFCLDNLDVLVNQEIIELFFKEYFRFIRNIDGIINDIDDDYIRNAEITYNSICSFALVCRQHTWARVKQHYPHNNPAIHLSTLPLDITDAFDKSKILEQRNRYISEEYMFFGEFADEVSSVCALLNDMDPNDRIHRSNIYDLFNDDYRQCTITFEDLLREHPELLSEYFFVKGKIHTVNQGLRGIIYKALFEKFKDENILSDIGVLDVNKDYPLVSNARLILNYLNYSTYGQNRCVPFSRIVADFEGIIDKDDIDLSLISMFNLGFDSSWNELIAFDEINTEIIDTCENTELRITPAGHEYLNLMATHFEFFNIRTLDGRRCKTALFSPKSIELYPRTGRTYECNGKSYTIKYNFEEIICEVMKSVEHCCENMTEFFERFMAGRYNKQQYLYSPYVYGDSDVLHGERMIHTHIRYIDNYRLYLLNYCDLDSLKEINEILVRFIEEYIRIGEDHPHVLTGKSTDVLFPAFKDSIQEIKNSDYMLKKDINIR